MKPSLLLIFAALLSAHSTRSFANESGALTLERDGHYLIIHGKEIPGGLIRINYLEAYCRAGSTDADWVQHTVVPHTSELLSVSTDRSVMKIRDTLADGVIVEHTITAHDDNVDFRLTAHNPTSKRSEAHWAQPCVRLGRFTGFSEEPGSNMEDYLPKCFLFLEGKLQRMPTKDWTKEARYTPGQVWCPADVPRTDVNPRPLSKRVPSNGLIGCFSADEKMIFATAWEPYQELFQGVARCLHSDFRLGGLQPGERKEIHGKIYLLKNDVPALLKRYRLDFPEHPGRDQTDAYLDFIRAKAAELRAKEPKPESLEAWKDQIALLRSQLRKAWGDFPAQPAPLDPHKLGEFQRNGYRVEKILFQTFPGVWMPANAYVPDTPGKHAAILAVHGHWPGAKQDPVVQARCIGAVKLGFFVLAVDAFGAGERGVGKALGEYHGEMTAATLLPVGLPLSGVQVYENMRAVDYLCSRPEVDETKIGITGASGGGNQTMYSGAWDNRLAAVVPVCSVGNYQAYLGAACCMCEVVPGALKFTEEWGVLGLTAPRALMVVNATRDAHQFSVEEANKSLVSAEPVYRLYGQSARLRHDIFESGHDYSAPMREAMYGWMTLHLKGEGPGKPIQEPEIKIEDPETLRCFPGNSRPDDWITLPKFAAARARQLLLAHRKPVSRSDWEARKYDRQIVLSSRVLGSSEETINLNRDVERTGPGTAYQLHFNSAPGINLTANVEPDADKAAGIAIVLDLNGAQSARVHEFSQELRHAGKSVVTIDLRATGAYARAKDSVGSAPDHNSAEWALWIGRPLLGQWVDDVVSLLVALQPSGHPEHTIDIIGIGPAGLVALCAGALNTSVTKVAMVGTLSSYITEEPYRGQRLGIMAPGILRDIGDVADISAMVAPRRLVIAGGVTGGGRALDQTELTSAFSPAEAIWKLLRADKKLTVTTATDAASVVRELK